MKTKTVYPPISKATNAYALLADVCKVITEEPKRVYMPRWIIKGTRALRATLTARGDASKPELVDGPACQTVGCIAGWVVTLARETPQTPVNSRDVEGKARVLLGATYAASMDDIDALSDLFGRTDISAGYGTKAYAREVVRYIKAYMRDHKPELLAKKV
jgi:hypothetical protein